MSYRDYRETDLFRQMESEMQRIADEALRVFLADVPAPDKFWQPRVDMHETPESVVLKVEIAGVSLNKLKVSLSSDDRVITISGERVEDDAERANRIRCYQLEIYFGPFERRILLPPEIRVEREGVRATCRDGVLVVTIPKRTTSTPDSRTIPITG